MFLLSSCVPSLANDVDSLARNAAETYLKAIKILEFPEGKSLFATVSWRNTDRIPTITDSTVLYEGMFSTDSPNLRGYKQMLEIKGTSKAGTGLVKRYMLVAYQDRQSKVWKVYDFREAADAAYEAEAAQARTLKPDPYMTQGIQFRHYGYWLMLAGKVTEAQVAFQTAGQENRKNPSSYVTQAEFENETAITDKILNARP
jgi:hypothetical protein